MKRSKAARSMKARRKIQRERILWQPRTEILIRLI